MSDRRTGDFAGPHDHAADEDCAECRAAGHIPPSEEGEVSKPKLTRITHVVYIESDDAEFVVEELEAAFAGSDVGQWRPKGYPKVEADVDDTDAQAAREFFLADQYEDDDEEWNGRPA